MYIQIHSYQSVSYAGPLIPCFSTNWLNIYTITAVSRQLETILEEKYNFVYYNDF